LILAEQTPEQIREHYEIEKELANRLRKAPRDQRLRMYADVYDELFKRVPHHSQLTRKVSPAEKMHFVSLQMKLLGPYLSPEQTFLEIGPGDCSLSLEISKHVKQVITVDVSAEITRQISLPGNFRLALSDGTSVPAPSASVDVAYSTDMIEHLHPEDALEHARSVIATLVPGGVYVCVTPNALCGPWDISMNFDKVPTGLHLKEYRISELARLLRAAGFSRIRIIVGARGTYLSLPALPSMILERLIEMAPSAIRKRLAAVFGPLGLKYIRMSGRK